MRKLKKIFIAAMLMAVSLVTYLCVTRVYAATATVTVNTYKYEEYTDYAFWSGWTTDYNIYLENVGYDGEAKAKTYWDCTASGRDAAYNMYATNDPTQSCYAYYGNKYPDEILASSTPITSLDTTTEFAPGDKIVFEFYLEASAGFRSTRLGFDFGENGMGNAKALSDATNHGVNYDISSDKTYYSLTFNSSIMKQTTSNGQTGHAKPYTGGYLEGSAASVTDNVLIGTIATTISDSASGEYSLTLESNSFFGDATTKYYSSDMVMSGVSKIKVAASTSNKTGLSSVTVGGTSLTSSGTTSLGGKNWPTYKASEVTTTTTSTSINVKTEDNGTIQNVYYVVQDSDGTLTTIPSTPATGSTGGKTGTFTIAPTTWNPGQTVYAVVEVLASDGETTGYNVIEIPKAKNTTKALTGLTVTSNGDNVKVNGVTTTAALSPSFATGTTNYTLSVAKNTTQLTITPTFDTGVYQKCYINGTEITSGSATPVTVSTSTTYVDVVMDSQVTGDANTTYRLSLNFLSDDTSLASSNPIKITYSGGTTSGSANATGSGTNYAATATVGSTGFTISATLKTPSEQKLEYSTDGTTFTTINSGTATPSISFDSGLAESVKQVTFRVWAEDGVNYEDYTVDVTRTGADDDNEITAITLYGETNDGDQTISGSFDSANVLTVASDLDYSVKGVKFKITFPTSATAVAVCGTQSCTLSSGSMSDLFSFGNTTSRKELTITITVTAADLTPNTYTIKVARREADDDSTVTVTVTNASNVTLPTTNTGLEYKVTDAVPYLTRKVYIQIDCGEFTDIKYNGSIITGKKAYDLPEEPVAAFPFKFTFYVCTEVNPSGYEMTIEIPREAADSNVELGSYSVYGKDDNKLYSQTAASTATSFIYEIPKSSAGSYYKLNLTAAADTTDIYVSTTVPSGTNYGTLYNAASNQFSIDTPLYVTLVAQGKQTRTYVFDVESTDERNTNPQVENIVISGLPDGVTFTFEKSTDPTKTFAVITVPYSIKGVTITPTLEEGHIETGGTSTWAQNDADDASALQVGDNTLHFQGRAENPSITSCDYIIIIHRLAGETGNLLTSLKINNVTMIDPADTDAPFTSTSKPIYYRISRADYLAGTTLATLNYTVSTGAEVIVTGSYGDTNALTYAENLSLGAKVTVTIKVRSDKNKIDNVASYNTYTVDLYVADDTYNVDNIELLLNDGSGDYLTTTDGSSFDFNDGVYSTFVVPFARPSAIPSVTLKTDSAYAKVTGEIGKNLAVGNNTFTITVTSEYAQLNSAITDQTKTYTITVNKEEADTNNYLSKLELYIGTNKVEFDSALQYVTVDGVDYIDNILYTKELIPASSVVTLKYETGSIKATVDETSTTTATLNSENTTSELAIKVLNENKVARTYKVKVSTEKLELDKNNDVSSIQVFADNDSDTNLITFVAADPDYSASVRYPVKNVILHFQLPAGSLATLEVDGNEVDKTSLKYTYALSTRPGDNVIEVKCYAEDTTVTPKTYEITITSLTPDENNNLKTFTINGTSVSAGQTIKLPNSTDKIDIEAERDSNYATLSPVNADNPAKYTATGQAINIGKNTVTIYVTNEKGETKEHTVTVIREADLGGEGTDPEDIVDPDDPEIDITGPTTDANSTTYEISVPYEQETFDLTGITAKDTDNTTISGNKVWDLTAGATTTCTVEITDKNSGTKYSYIYKVTRDGGSDDNYITKYTDGYGNENNVATTTEVITYVVPKNVLTFDPVITVSETAKVDPDTGLQYKIYESNRTLTDGKNTFHITVTSQNNKERKYTFNVYRSDINHEIDKLELLDKQNGSNIKDINENELAWDSNNECTLKFAYSTKTAYLNIVPASADAVVYVNGNVFTSQTISIEGTKTYEIYIKSEYGIDNPSAVDTESKKYKLTIEQEEPNGDSTLKELTVKYINDDGEEVTVTATASDLSKQELNVANIGNTATSIYIGAVANVPAPKTSITGDKTQILRALSVSGDDISGYIFTFEVICTAENDKSTKYIINVARGPLDLDNDNKITHIDIIDSMENVYMDKEFDLTLATNPDKPFEITIPYGPQSYTITAHKLEVSPATIVGHGQFAITFKDGKDMVSTHEIYAVSASSIDGTKYYIKITCKAPSDDSSLKDLKIDGVTVSGFDPETKDYIITPAYPNEITTLNLAAVANDANAKLSGDIGVLNLKEGTNSFTVTVTAQSGSITNYKVIVTRDYPLPYLTDLEFVGEKLLNEKDKETIFDKDVFEYHAIVTFMDMTATINASVDNPTHIVACSNSSVITNTGTTRTFTVLLNEGINRFTISVTSVEGKKQTYNIVIQRRGLASTNTNIAIAEIDEIEKFKDDYSNLQSVYEYTVPNKVRDLNVRVTCENVANGINEGATYKVYNDKNLKVGLNQVIILIIAEDTETTRAVLVNVTRLPMEFTVNKEATEYTCTQSTKDEMTYVIDLGKNDASAIEDYTKFIEFAEEDNLSVEVLTDTEKDDCREVIVRVSDGSEEQLVRFELLSTATTKGSSFNFVVWLLLAVAIVILGTILICVNKDKYGTISKKRKNA